MGAGRSGTTVLDVMLGNSQDIFSCGELTRFAELNGIPHNYPENSKTALFWTHFKTSLENKLGGAMDYQALLKLYLQFDHHKGFIRNWAGLQPDSEFKRYKSFWNIFFDMLFEIANKNVLVDSSKYPNRALTLSRALSYELCYIYLIRNPAAVINAFTKKDVEQPPRNWASANKYYFAVNLSCSLTKRALQKQHKLMVVKFEDMITAPIETLEQIQDAFDMDLSGSIEIIKSRQPFEVGRLFDGNRLRLKEKIMLRSDLTHYNLSFKEKISILINFLWWR